MEILTILQIITILTSILSLLTSYIFRTREKKKDAMASLYSEQLIKNLHSLRSDIAEILALANPDTIEEIIVNDKKELKSVPFLEQDLNKHIDNIKSLFFPYYPQEAELFQKLEKVHKLALAYKDNPTDKNLKQELLNANHKLYISFALYDRGMWEAIIKQTTEHKYDGYVFDEEYERISDEVKIHILDEKTAHYNRTAHASINTKTILNNKK